MLEGAKSYDMGTDGGNDKFAAAIASSQLLDDVFLGRSSNTRLESIFSARPEYLNRELVVSPKLETPPVYVNPIIRGKLEAELREKVPAIITPASWLTLVKQPTSARILASPYECGRVLELDEKMEIAGVPYVITFKGVGATSFCRQTGTNNPWVRADSCRFTEEDRAELRKNSIWRWFGTFTAEDAKSNLRGIKIFSNAGCETEQILAIYHISHFPDPNGELQPISWFKDRGIINLDIDPVISVRAARSNIRLLDFVMFEKLEKQDLILPVLDHACREYAQYNALARCSIQEYFEGLAVKLIRHQLPLILTGINLESDLWQDWARNISILGEDLDLENIFYHDGSYEEYEEYYIRVKGYFAALENVLKNVGDVVNRNTESELNLSQLGKIMAEEVLSALDSFDYFNLLQSMIAAKVRAANHPISKVKALAEYAVLGAFFGKCDLQAGHPLEDYHEITEKMLRARYEAAIACLAFGT